MAPAALALAIAWLIPASAQAAGSAGPQDAPVLYVTHFENPVLFESATTDEGLSVALRTAPPSSDPSGFGSQAASATASTLPLLAIGLGVIALRGRDRPRIEAAAC